MIKNFGKAVVIAGVIVSASATSGCALGVAAGAGAIAADELNESEKCDDDFDPLEGVTGSEDGCN